MYKGKIFLLICLVFLSTSIVGQSTLFPYCYKYVPSEGLFEDIYLEQLNLTVDYTSNGDLIGLENSISIIEDMVYFKNPVEKGHLENRKGILEFYKNNSTQSLVHYINALNIFSRQNYISGTNTILNNISLIFDIIHDTESAIKYLERAIEFTPADDIGSMAVFRLNLIEYNLDLGNWEKAFDLAISLYSEYDKDGFQFSEVAIIGLIVDALNKMGRYEEAGEWVDLGLEKVYDDLDYIDKITFYPYIIDYYYLTKEYQLSVDLADMLFPLPSISFSEDIFETLGILSKACLNLGIYEKAWEYSDWAMQIEASRESIDKEELIEVLMVNYVYEREQNKRIEIDREIAINNEKENSQKSLMVILILATMVILVLMVILYRARKVRMNFREKLADENKKLAQINLELNRRNKENEKENNLLDTLISVFAHDLINPFQAILGFSNLIISESNNLEKKEMLEYSSILSDTSFQLNQLLINLKSMSVVQNESQQLESVSFEITEVIREVLNLFAPSAFKKSINIIFDAEEQFNAYMNPEIFQSIVRNVLSNAIKFSQTGSDVNIEVSGTGNETIVEIRDNGIGMSEETRIKLINREFLSSRPGTTSEWGSGLGLSISIELLEIYRGRVEIDSVEGEGTLIRIIVPINRNVKE